jgi:hypothetical protein
MSAVLVPPAARPACFLSPLCVQEVDDHSADGRGSWKLCSTLSYYSAVVGRQFDVPVDFVTDFASVPRLPIVFAWLGDRGHPAAVVHDWLYTAQPISREAADDVLREAMQLCGLSAFEAWAVWKGVRWGGASHWPALAQAQVPHVVVAVANERLKAELPEISD